LALGHHAVLAAVSSRCPPPGDRYLRVTHPSATDRSYPRSVRLACVKHAASVRSEPGSNSQVHHAGTRRTQQNEQTLSLSIRLFSLRCGAPETILTSVTVTHHQKIHHRYALKHQNLSRQSSYHAPSSTRPNAQTIQHTHMRQTQGRRQRIPSCSDVIVKEHPAMPVPRQTLRLVAGGAL
jgi:hypothetical protein